MRRVVVRSCPEVSASARWEQLEAERQRHVQQPSRSLDILSLHFWVDRTVDVAKPPTQAGYDEWRPGRWILEHFWRMTGAQSNHELRRCSSRKCDLAVAGWEVRY
eukprot:1740482-Rhodomonas_salina.2